MATTPSPDIRPRQRFGFAGLDDAAQPLAAALARAGHALTVFDPDLPRAEAFASRSGVQVARSIGELGGLGPVLVSPRGGGQADLFDALSAVLGAGGIAVDMSARDPVRTRALGAELVRRGAVMIDAPPIGPAGRQRLVLGCDDDSALDLALPALRALGMPLLPAGSLGSGQAMRLLAEHVGARTRSAAAEALLVGDRLRLNPASLRVALEEAAAQGLDLDSLSHTPAHGRDFAVGLALGLLAGERPAQELPGTPPAGLTRLLIEFTTPLNDPETHP